MTADRYRRASVAGRPLSWNKYSYVEGDPINYNDPRGRFISSKGVDESDDNDGGPDPYDRLH